MGHNLTVQILSQLREKFQTEVESFVFQAYTLWVASRAEWKSKMFRNLVEKLQSSCFSLWWTAISNEAMCLCQKS